jgi:DNA-binding LacI/PurR family transcriptional regulator
MATIADVAKRAGVAVSTVSYALSGARPVSESTRQRILEAVAELGYHPNVLARGLASKRTRVIALLFPAGARGLFQVQLDFINAAADVASQQGYALLLWTSPDDDQGILRLVNEGLIEGLVLMEINLHDSRVETLRALGHPFCMIGHCEHNDDIGFVDFDFDQAIRLCGQHLAGMGHRRIAYIISTPGPIEQGYGPAVRCLQGIEALSRECGLNSVARLCEPTAESSCGTMRALLESNPERTAVIVTSDALYTGAIQAIREKGMSVPRDLSLAGIVSSRFAELMTPSVTNVELPASEMGRIGTEMLIRQLDGGKSSPTQLMLPATLSVRQSTAPPRR